MPVDYFDQLRDQVEQEVMACIGCNDCMLACPLPQKQFVTIAELNAGVLMERITAPNVADFVEACTQCQQCIPVCPADLHRADMVLWNKMKWEDAVPDQVMPLQVGEQTLPSSWSLDAVARYLAGIPLFKGVTSKHLRRMLISATLRQLAPGEVLCREGEFYERLYIVLDGQIEQLITDANGRQTRLLLIGPGSFHGETGVLGNQEEAYTVAATRPALILELSKATTHRLMKESAPFKGTMDELYRRHALWTYARQSPLFAPLSEKTVEALLNRASVQILRAGDVLFREGDPPGAIYLVRAGFLKVSRQTGDSELVIQYFREGDLFGGTALLFDQPQTATISANTRSEVVVIPGDAIRNLLLRDPALHSRLLAETERSEEILRSSVGQRAPVRAPMAESGIATMHTLSLEGLVDQGVIQGHEVLVIDTSICTNCNNCVESCERRHGYSRLERRGLQLSNLLFPTACRHCEDPVCLLCSVNGIVRKPDGEITIVTDNCIGCGACAERCPYHNIQMHDREKEESNPVLDLLAMFGFKGKQVHGEHHKAAQVAVKCDLCQGYNDYACVRGCPVGAAMRINPLEHFNLTNLHIGLEMKKGDQ